MKGRLRRTKGPKLAIIRYGELRFLMFFRKDTEFFLGRNPSNKWKGDQHVRISYSRIS